MKKFILCIIGIGLLYTYSLHVTRGSRHIKSTCWRENVYAVAEGYGVPDYHTNGRAMYSLKGIDESGNEEEYTVGTNTPNDFIRKTYLRIHVKGKYVYSYEAISEKDIPEKIRKQLEVEIK